MQVKTKDLQEVEIKFLRKISTFKPSPMPSFYHEAAPSKVGMKKAPLTCKKYPKLGKRNSYDGVESEIYPNQVCRTSGFNFLLEKEQWVCANMKKNVDKDMERKRTFRRSLKKEYSNKYISSKSNEIPFSLKQEISNCPKDKPIDESSKAGNEISSTNSKKYSSRSDMNGLTPQKFEVVEE